MKYEIIRGTSNNRGEPQFNEGGVVCEGHTLKSNMGALMPDWYVTRFEDVCTRFCGQCKRKQRFERDRILRRCEGKYLTTQLVCHGDRGDSITRSVFDIR